jgi:pimeloyl-ACP methyl ester carboxylesterase
MTLLRWAGVSIFFEHDGRPAADPLVHGWCCDHTFFGPQFEHFHARRPSVVAVDLRGHGQSDKPHETYTMQLFADDLAFLREELGLERPVVIGHSMGGVVARSATFRPSGRNNQAVVCASAPGAAKPSRPS